MLGDIFKRKGVVVGSILFGTLIGGSIGVYIRDNWDIQARETRVAELEKQVEEKKDIVNRLRERVEGKK